MLLNRSLFDDFDVKSVKIIKSVAEEYYPEEAWLNQYAWMYIVGGVLLWV